jgi:hypothetical protein
VSEQQLYFLYELAKVLASSIDLAEVTEYALDGACALLGTEQGFIYFLDDRGELRPHAGRGLNTQELENLADFLVRCVLEQRTATATHPQSMAGTVLAAPLMVQKQVQGLIGVATVYARDFTRQEEERLGAVAHLAALALENARLHDKAQRELVILRRLMHAAHKMAEGTLTPGEAAELEQVEGWDDISQLRQIFGQMAREVIRREEDLRRQVESLRIQIDEAKRERQVAEITETEYFQELRKRARKMRIREENHE